MSYLTKELSVDLTTNYKSKKNHDYQGGILKFMKDLNEERVEFFIYGHYSDCVESYYGEEGYDLLLLMYLGVSEIKYLYRLIEKGSDVELEISHDRGGNIMINYDLSANELVFRITIDNKYIAIEFKDYNWCGDEEKTKEFFLVKLENLLNVLD